MKKTVRVVSLCLLICMLFTVVSCSSGEKKAFATSKEAYDKLTSAYQAVDTYASDIYNAWYGGIYDDDELSFSYMSRKTSLTVPELQEGLVYLILGDEYESTDEAKKDSYRNESMFDAMLSFYTQEFAFCTDLVNAAYEVSGKQGEIQTQLDESKTLLKSLSTDYSDYEHYPNLKNLYTTVNAFFEYCCDPTGSFEQSKTTINDYRNQARGYMNDLEFIFGE